jgi:hypothetical protein
VCKQAALVPVIFEPLCIISKVHPLIQKRTNYITQTAALPGVYETVNRDFSNQSKYTDYIREVSSGEYLNLGETNYNKPQ